MDWLLAPVLGVHSEFKDAVSNKSDILPLLNHICSVVAFRKMHEPHGARLWWLALFSLVGYARAESIIGDILLNYPPEALGETQTVLTHLLVVAVISYCPNDALYRLLGLKVPYFILESASLISVTANVTKRMAHCRSMNSHLEMLPLLYGSLMFTWGPCIQKLACGKYPAWRETRFGVFLAFVLWAVPFFTKEGNLPPANTEQDACLMLLYVIVVVMALKHFYDPGLDPTIPLTVLADFLPLPQGVPPHEDRIRRRGHRGGRHPPARPRKHTATSDDCDDDSLTERPVRPDLKAE
mmetsp:Transcript_23205/g.56463  ORF Transcript_23205/g.56463 Transcript_23205/m.56463 type:complete len:296 (-) Transcript_23205:474-1361(-)